MPDAPKLDNKQVAEAIETNKELDAIARQRPTLDDYVAEGVLPYKPEGKFSLPVDGRRYLQMNERANRLSAEYADNHYDSPRRRAMREARAERKARKFFVPKPSMMVGHGVTGWQYRCSHGHTFGFLPGRPALTARPCVRSGCDSVGVLERA